MANLTPRYNKDGRLISYSIRVHRGRGADGKQLKPWTATFDVAPTWSAKTARKKAEAFAATFEKQCREGLTSDGRKKFAEYCDYVLALKEQRGAKHSTVVRYRELTERIYPAIGHIKLNELRADHLNSLYTELSKPGSAKSRSWARSKTDLAAVLKERDISRAKLAEATGLPLNKVYAAVRGERVNAEAAEAVCKALNLKLSEAFLVVRDNKALSAKTVLEHHRLISTVLEQALKEGLVAVNVASRATLPKVERKEVNYFQPEQIAAIREALEHE
ncbi:MAG TPA: helix-turn-helix transcriptional regulator, partial [Candidatus Scatomorpha stercoravium]|nr:helix-turn-helix transcriptional regulator [Candidatus Scatomorpha stercoravium]